MSKLNIFTLLIIVVSFGMALAFYPTLPVLMASHWNYLGEVDGYVPKLLGVLIMPVLSSIMFVMFYVLRRVDPHKENIDKFSASYDSFMLLIVLFLFFINILTYLWSYNIQFSMTLVLLPAMSMLFYYLGVILEKTKRNWFLGIRTPWTLASDYNWEKTHILAGLLFKYTGVILMSAIVWPKIGFILVLLYLLGMSLALFIYSYVLSKKEHL